MIDEVRTVVYKNIRKLSETSSSTAIPTNEYLPVPPPSSISVHSHPYQSKEDESSHPQQISSGEEEIEIDENPCNRTLMKKIRGTTKKTMQQAEEGFIKLDNVIRQIRTNIHKK